MRRLVVAHVDRVIWDHPRSDHEKQIQMGFPMEQIRTSILARGLADFSVGYREPSGLSLSPDELVSLYSYSNMKGHFFTCSATFQEHQEVLEDLFKPRGRVLMIDVGCGPATACLALADLLPSRRIDYIGIDSAEAMRAQAQKLFEAAKDGAKLLQTDSVPAFKPCWTAVPVEHIAHEDSVMLVFSYFFASKSLMAQDVKGMAAWVASLASTRAGRPLLSFYMNSTDHRANEKYYQLRTCLGVASPQQPLPAKQIEFQTLKGGDHISKREYVSELLTLSGGVSAGTVAEKDFIPL
jgi:hypothetical protein